MAWLKIHKPALWPFATLQALAGLRVKEVAALRLQDVNLRDAVIYVLDTETISSFLAGLPVWRDAGG